MLQNVQESLAGIRREIEEAGISGSDIAVEVFEKLYGPLADINNSIREYAIDIDDIGSVVSSAVDRINSEISSHALDSFEVESAVESATSFKFSDIENQLSDIKSSLNS